MLTIRASEMGDPRPIAERGRTDRLSALNVYCNSLPGIGPCIDYDNAHCLHPVPGGRTPTEVHQGSRPGPD